MSNSAWFGMAPRPATPTGNRSYDNGSAPNSPGGLSRIERVPSRDAMERSAHNDSGHGKSTLQTIKELKTGNAKLTARMAEMEAEFMNNINELNTQFHEKEESLQRALDTKEQQIATMESRAVSTENRIRERDSQLSQLKEETTFQRHTIADLKNQLYQLQHEIEDAEYDKRDEVDKWLVEKQEMEREMETLRSQVQSQSTMQNWKQLEGSKKELEETKARLREAQSSLASLEQQKKRAEKERTTEQSTVAVLKQDVAEKDQIISSLREDVTKYSNQVASLTSEITEIKAEAQNEDKYRRDEVEDLRVLNASLRENIDLLKVELDDAERELDEKDEMLLDKNNEINDLRNEIDSLSKKIQDTKVRASEGDQQKIQELVEQLEESRNETEEVRGELRSISHKFTRKVDSLQKEINELVANRDDLESKLVATEDERDQARRDLDAGRHSLTQNETRTEQRLRDIVAKAAKDRDEAETEFAARLKEVEKTYQKKMQDLASKTVDTQEVHSLRQETVKMSLEIDQLREQCRQAEADAAAAKGSSSVELETLREKVMSMESKRASADRTKKQLRDAQIALVALDDEKTLAEAKLREQVRAVEVMKGELEREFNAQLMQKDGELKRLRDTSSQLSEYVMEIEKLKDELKEKDAQIDESKSRSMRAVTSGSGDAMLRKQLSLAKESEEKLRKSLYAVRQELNDNKKKLREKMEDRDTTISALVKASVTQEQKVESMKKEIEALKKKNSGGTPQELDAVRRAREAEYLDEIENLHTALDDVKAIDNRLMHHVSTLERQLADVEADNKRLRERLGSNSSTKLFSLQIDDKETLQERDYAISNLVKQSMTLEQQVSVLKAENISLRTELEGFSAGLRNQTGPNWAEVRRLQKESEIFAGQIIEQDEELESLRAAIKERDSRISSLEREVLSLKKKVSVREVQNDRADEFQAELDELQEANNTQRVELREMRKQLRETKAAANEAMDLRAELEQAQYALENLKSKAGSTARDDAKLKIQLETVQSEKDDIEKKLNQQIDSMRRLRNSAVDNMEEKLKEKDAEIEKLKRNDRLLLLEKEIKNLSKNLFEKAEMLENAQIANNELQKALDEYRNADEMAKSDHEKQRLLDEVNELKNRLSQLETDKENIDSMKQQLESVTHEKEEIERRIMETYERRMSHLKLDKDITIDGLRKQLVEAKAETTETSEDVEKHLVALEQENRDLREEFEAKMQLKNSKIYALEQTLGAQEQLVESMRAEMDQLQSSMERTSLGRRAEIEELQQEMIDTSSKAQRQEREITSLKMTLEELRLEHSAEVVKLKDQMLHMEKPQLSAIPLDIMPPSTTKLDDYKERLENMKWRNTTLQEENLKLRNRLEKLDDATRMDQDASSSVQDEVTRLRKQVRELEDKLTSMAPSARPSARPTSPRNAPKARSGESGSSRSSKGRTAFASPTRTREQTSASPRKSQSGALRFLKRKQSKDTNGDALKGSNDETSSSGSKMTF